jgi:uncharacterized MAPEG superfamily protein
LPSHPSLWPAFPHQIHLPIPVPILASNPNSPSQIKLIQTANPKTWNNANPRGQDTNSAYKKSVPADVFAAYERAEAAHKNLLENAPLFVGAVLAGCYAGVDSGESVLFFSLRII